MGACCVQGALGIILKDEDKQQFVDNIEKWGCVLGKGVNNQMFGLVNYSSNYCKLGCNILMDGYAVFRGWMLEHTGLYVFSFITIQPMASTFMSKSGCYDKVYQISGVLQQFISRCVVGGRVTANSDKQYHVKRKMEQILMHVLYILLQCTVWMGF